MTWDSALKCWRSTEVVFENHPSARLESYKKFREKIVTSLISAGPIAKEEEIRNADDSGHSVGTQWNLRYPSGQLSNGPYSYPNGPNLS